MSVKNLGRLAVDQREGIEGMIRRACFCMLNVDIASLFRDCVERKEPFSIEAGLAMFDQGVESLYEVIRAVKKRGYLLAGADVGLAFACQFPDVQQRQSVVCLGARKPYQGGEGALCLDGNPSRRIATIDRCEGWSSAQAFLVYRGFEPLS